jgi:hypothetical protein
MSPRKEKTPLERMSTRHLVGEVKRTLRYKLREMSAASKPKKRKE